MKIRIISALLIIDLALLCGIGSGPAFVKQKIVKTVFHQVEHYSSGKDTPVPFRETTDHGSNEIDISFRLKARSFKAYPNIFQTAPYNEGLRMELSAPGNLGLIVGLTHHQVKGFALTRMLTLNEWHTIDLHLNRDRHLTVDIDGYRSVDVGESDLNPKISEIRVGGGFDGARPFVGEIEAFKISYRLLNGWPAQTLRNISLAMAITGLLLLVILLLSIEPAQRHTAPLLGRERTLGAGLVLVLACFASTWVYKDFFTYRSLFPPYGGVIDFDSHSANSQLSAVREWASQPPAVDGIRIRFDMKPYSFMGYPNVFQTAPVNDGIRMELASTGVAGFLTGHLVGGTIKGCGTVQIKINQWSKVSIQTDRGDFVKIIVDGHSVFDEQVGGGLHFDLTDIVVGAGFSKLRPFDGAVRDFRLEYQSPVTRFYLLLLRVALILVAAVLLYQLRRPIFAARDGLKAWYQSHFRSDLARFSLKFAIFMVPVSIFFGTIEYHLYTMPNNYSQKRHHFESRLNDLQVLVIGSSNAFFGINPRLFSLPGFNLSYRGQAVYYDDQMVQRYLDRMPKLKVAVITVVYLTFGTQQYMVDAPRAYFYEHYWGIPPTRRTGHGVDLEYRIDPKRISLIAMYGETTPHYISNGYQENIDPDPENTGWFNAGIQPCNVSLNVGPDGARIHNRMVQVEKFGENALLLQDMIVRLQKRQIIPILIELPINHVYTDFVDKSKWDQMQAALNEVARKRHIQFVDYTFDPRFTLNDFTDLPDHMNALGAEKFTRIINLLIAHQLQAVKPT